MRDEDKLEAMERKLKVIEKFIIHDVANKIAMNESKTLLVVGNLIHGLLIFNYYHNQDI